MKGRDYQTVEEIRFGRTVSAWILQLRKRLALSTRELADVCDVDRNTISRWENGATIPSTFHLFLLRAFARKQGEKVPEL